SLHGSHWCLDCPSARVADAVDREHAAEFYPNYACALLTVVPARLRLGRQIREARALGGYQLVERLGEDGMGEVWLGRHRLLARSAAIKLIRPEMLSDGSVDRAAVALGRFEREARATAALNSPHNLL